MRIRKVSNTRPLSATVVNEYNNNQINAYSCDYINGALDYSTDEVNTHKKWIDGKDIYRKTFIGTYEDKAILLNNVSSLVNSYGTADPGTGLLRQIPYYEVYQGNSYAARLEFYQNQVRVQGMHAGAFHSITGEFTLEYTKVTQSTRSLNTYSGDIEEKKDIVIDDGGEETPIDEGNDENNK